MPELYRLQNDAKPGELGGPPFILGSFLRFPSTAYGNWGVRGDPKVLYERSLSVYRDEFMDTSPAWMDSVIETADVAGIGNRPQMLRNEAGRIAAMLTKRMMRNGRCGSKRKIHVADVGAGSGGSLIAYLDALEESMPGYSKHLVLTPVDLSRQSLWKAEDVLVEKGFIPGETLFPVDCRDVDMLSHIDGSSQDIVINVAGIHANACLEKPMKSIAGILKERGYFVSGDWHHARWLHPSHTYKLLDEMDPKEFGWKNKDAFMDEFRKKVPRAMEKPDMEKMDEADTRAIEEIGNYWKAWAAVRKKRISEGRLKPTDEQIVAEGHRPVGDYVTYASHEGMYIDDSAVSEGIVGANPMQVVPGTSLNMAVVLKKER